MLNIKLNDKYYIESDRLNYILKEKKIAAAGKNKGKEIFVNVGYYTTINQLLNKLVEFEIKESDINELKQIKLLIEKLANEITKKY